MEDTLRFYDQQGRLLPRLKGLRGNRRKLFAELAEARAGRFLNNSGSRILGWEPPSHMGNNLGDILVQWGATAPVFVEVKGPDWEGEFEGELEKEEFLKRKALGRYVDVESRAVSPVGTSFRVIRKNILRKLAGDRPSLAVIVDDFRDSPAEARGVIEGSVAAFFGGPDVKRLGGVLFLKPETVWGKPVYYLSNFYHNPNAFAACRLPGPVIDVLTASADRDAAMIA
jgi:hypothetical protein